MNLRDKQIEFKEYIMIYVRMSDFGLLFAK